MKKIVFLLVAVGAMLASCNPMEDVYDELDNNQKAVVGNDNITLTDDDYDALDLDEGEFETDDQAKTLLPDFLSDKYPFWGQGSSVIVDYNLAPGGIDGVGEYMAATDYTLAKDDYAASGSQGAAFYPNEDPTSYLPDVLTTQFPNATEGEIVLLQYKQYVSTPTIGSANIVEYAFAGSFLGWTVTDVLGAEGWTAESAYAQGNGYNGGAMANDDWLISPEIDLTGETDVKFQISQAINYATNLDFMSILVSTDYTTDVNAATWTPINLATSPAGNSNDFVLSEEFDFSAYDNTKLHIAFRYQSTDTDAGRWRIENVALKTIGVTGATNDLSSYYQLDENGDWQLVEDVYYLSAADYDTMGTGSGQPGQYNNFSSSIPPNNYLPVFLASKYPYAQEEDQITLMYKYYNGATVVFGNIYTYTNGVWEGYKASLQFGYDDGVWVPDNTIQYALVRSDYDYLAAELANEPGYENAASSMGNYGNLDRREGTSAYWSDEMIAVAMDILLDKLDPSAAEEQKYLVTFDIYNGTNTTETIAMIKINGEWIVNE